MLKIQELPVYHAASYCTVSHAAKLVNAGTSPIDLWQKKREKIDKAMKKRIARMMTMKKWQERWSREPKADEQ